MRRNVVPWLKFAVCGLVLCGHLALLATLMYPMTMLGVVAAAVIAMPFGERAQGRSENYTQATSAGSILALLIIFVSSISLGPMDTVLWLMVLVQVHVLLHQKRQRHYAYLILMAFSQVMAACMMSPDPAVALVLALLVIFTVWALVLLDIFRSTHERGDVVVHGTLDHDARNGVVRADGVRYFRRTLYNWVGALIVMTTLMSVTYFVLMPRSEAGMFGADDIFPAQEEFTTGLASEIDLRSSGRITEDRTAIMQVSFKDTEDGRFNGPLYWRVITFDTYNGDQWDRNGLTTRSIWMVPRLAHYANTGSGIRPSEEGVYRIPPDSSSAVAYDVFLAQLPPDGIPLLSIPQMVRPSAENEGTWLWDEAGDFSVQYADRGEAGARYEAVSIIADYTPDELRQSAEDYRNVMNARDYQMLTQQDLLPDTIALAREIAGDADNAYDVCKRIENYLSGPNYEYSLDIPELPIQNPMDAFITDVRSGHCQLYGSAMAMLVRSFGIPSRLVTGYRGGIFDSDAQNYSVTANMAHVWVEVLFPDVGWVIFDPSPRAPEASILSFDTLRTNYSISLLKLRLFWLENVVGFRSSQVIGDDEAPETSASDSVALSDDPTDERDPIVSMSTWAGWGAMALLFTILVLPAVLRYRRVLHRRRAEQGLGESQRRAVRLYRELQRKIGRFGLEIQGLTAEEVRDAARDAGIPDIGTLERVVTVYNQARFGERPLDTEEWKTLRRRVSAMRPVSS